MDIEYRPACFLIPVLDGEIWLGRRGTEPHKNQYGAIGGKAIEHRDSGLANAPRVIETIGGGSKLSVADRLAQEYGLEWPAETAVREFCEEAFSDQRYPEDFAEGDITNIIQLGGMNDDISGRTYHCLVYLATIHRTDFSLSRRELSDLRPLSTVHPETIFPLTQLALLHLKYVLREKAWMPPKWYNGYESEDLERRIPKFEHLEYRPSSFLGAISFFHERGLI